MTLAIYNTQDWSPERLFPYGRDITAALHKLVDRFPRDLTMNSLSQDIMSGAQQLWLILEGEEFRSFVLTEVKVNAATGNKSVLVTALAGEGGVDVCPLIASIEDWARSIGAHEVMPVGRFGWKKALGKIGYEANTILYRKELT